VNTPFAKLMHSKDQPAEQNDTGSIMSKVTGVCVGKIVTVEKEGQVKVDFPNNPNPPVFARSIIGVTQDDKDREVLLAFDNGDPLLPLIAGFIQNQPVVDERSETFKLNRESLKDIVLDGRRITFDAEEEILLRCGDGSVKLRKDGTIIIKGTRLVSRARATNKIKGAAVSIN
jgi:RNase P/RNase MRP subunit p29